MNGLLHHLGLTLRLHFRNRMALFYGYLFPIVFLVAFWVLYRHDRVPLARHMGELLTVTVLGGACFGLPTTMVSERERGVWRRYRLSPLSIGSLVASTVVARYFLVLSAGLLQVALAMGLGLPMPEHPLELLGAFTLVAFAFLGLGLVIATLADNVPSVQALGQCIFLPMLIIGGVAVPLRALPDWAQHVSAFFPGRYSVEAMQACVTGGDLSTVGFALLALALIGVAGCVAGAKMFRWDAQQRFAPRGNRGWIGLTLFAWMAVGLLAEVQGRIAVASDEEELATRVIPKQPVAAAPLSEDPPPAAAPDPSPEKTPPAESPPLSPAAEPETETAAREPRSWEEITPAHIAAIRQFSVPPDGGVVTPFASPQEMPDEGDFEVLDEIYQNLLYWPPANVEDPVQRVRNYLYVAAVPDAVQMSLERHIPVVVFSALQQTVPRQQLIKVLSWIALHPKEGDVESIDRLAEVGIPESAYPPLVQERAYFYAIKFLVRLTEEQ